MGGRLLVAITVLGLFLRVLYVWLAFDESMLVYHRGDWPEYRIAAEAIMAGDWEFRHSHFLVRPPLFPLLAALLNIHEWSIILVNTLIAVGIIPATYALARRLRVGVNAALAAAFIVAIDLTSVRLSGVLLAEPLANLLLALGFVGIAALRDAKGRGRVLALALAAGLLIWLSAFTRPAAFLLWIPLAGWVFMSRHNLRWLAALAFALPVALGVGGWMHHNLVYFRNASFSSIGTFNLLYYHAASVYYVAHGRSGIDATYTELARRVEEGMGNDVADVGPNRRYNHRGPDAKRADVMRSVAVDVFREYPLEYLVTIPVGLYRILVEVRNIPWVMAVCWNLAFLVAAGAGAWRLVRERKWSLLVFLCLPCLYFIAGTLAVQSSGIDTRARVMVTPLLGILAALSWPWMNDFCAVVRRKAQSICLSMGLNMKKKRKFLSVNTERQLRVVALYVSLLTSAVLIAAALVEPGLF